MRCVRISAIGLCLVLAACTSAGSGPAATPTSTAPAPGPPATTPAGGPSPVPPGLAWSTYHGDNARTGLSPAPALEPPLHKAWTRELDGKVYAQPIAAGDTVIAATENNSVYALRADSGTIIWRRHLGDPVPLDQLPCGNIDPLGITGTPAYDVRTGTVFVVTETAGGSHDLHAIDARRGTVRWTRNLDVVDRDRRAQQQRGALLVSHGRVYVAFGGLFGDCGNYIGYVTALETDGKGAVAHYEVPSGREAGIWAAPGPVEDGDRHTSDLLVAVGNGSGTGGTFDGSDSVLRLSPTLERRALFAPSSWADDNAADLDLGSMSPVVVGDRVVIAGKRGTVYLLPRELGGIGGELDTLDGCKGFGGAAALSHVVVLPCSDGLRRLTVFHDDMRWDWRLPGVAGSPIIVRSTVYTLRQDTGDLYAVDLVSGRVRAQVHVGDVTRFATPAPAGQLIVIGTTSGVVAVRGS